MYILYTIIMAISTVLGKQAEQFSIRANGSADKKDHSIQFGFEYEKERIEGGLLLKFAGVCETVNQFPYFGIRSTNHNSMLWVHMTKCTMID